MLRAGQAIRMGLRAATRNPELSFGKSLLDLMGTVMGALPILLAGFLLWRAFAGLPLVPALVHLAQALARMGWPLAGALFTAAALSWALGAGFWAGALPSLAVDVEMDARAPKGTFFRLAAAGFARVSGASAIASLLSILAALLLFLALLFGVPLFFLSPSTPLAAALAAILTCSLGTGFFVDLLGSLSLVRAAVLGDGPATAYLRAARLLGERLGAALAISIAFLLLEIVVATTLGAFLSPLFIDDSFDLPLQLFALGPRVAVSIASAVVLAWVELAQKGALAALAADAEGLLTLPPEPPPPPRPPLRQARRTVQTWELRPPKIAVQPLTPEHVIEALPVEEEPVIEALPVAEPPSDAAPADPTGPASDDAPKS